MVTWWKSDNFITPLFDFDNPDKPKENIQFGIYHDSKTSMISGLVIDRLQNILDLEKEDQYIYQIPQRTYAKGNRFRI